MLEFPRDGDAHPAARFIVEVVVDVALLLEHVRLQGAQLRVLQCSLAVILSGRRLTSRRFRLGDQ